MRPGRLPRRAFLRAGAALAALGWAAAPASPALAGALPRHNAGDFIPDADQLAANIARFEAALLPAYAAAGLIRQEALAPLPASAAGRPHDPAGAFTWPGAWAVLALVYRGAPPERPALADAFHPRAIWPDFGRLALAAALLHRGRHPAEAHPGHWAQALQDLREARPRLAADPLRALAAGQGEVALALVDVSRLPPAARLPAEGRLILEFDWVIPRGPAGRHTSAVAAFLRRQPAAPPPAGPALTLGPLPPLAGARLAGWWPRLREYLCAA